MEKMKKINVSEFCWWLLLGALIIVIGKLLVFDELKFYLHPKMAKFVIAGEIILIVLFVYQQTKLFKEGRSRFRIGYFLFLVPMFMLILAGDASAIIFENRTVNLNGFSQVQAAASAPAESEETKAEAESPSAYDMLPEGEMNSPDPGATDPTDPEASSTAADGTAVGLKTEDAFLQTLFNMEKNKEGQEISLEGFVYRDELFSENEFLVSRMLVNCCAADANLIGMIAVTSAADTFANSDWVRVKGVTKNSLVKNPATGEAESRMVLEVREIEKIEPLESPYVYFSY